MTTRMSDAVKLLRDLVPELAKFGVIGSIGAVIDLGGASVLYGVYHFGPLKAKAIAIITAAIVTYLGNKFWTFRHRENHHWLLEIVLFAVLNAVGLLIAEAVIAFTTYGLDERGTFAYTMASIAGTGLGTIFRYFAYKRWIWLAPRTLPGQFPHPPAPERAPRTVRNAPPDGPPAPNDHGEWVVDHTLYWSTTHSPWSCGRAADPGRDSRLGDSYGG